MRHLIFQCPDTGKEFLIDSQTGEYEALEPEETEVEEGMTVNQMIEEDDDLDDEEPEGYDPKFSTDPEYRTNTQFDTAYANGTPIVPGKPSGDGLKIQNKPVTRCGSGIRVETAMATEPPPGVRQKRRKLNLQPPGVAKPFAPKRKKPSELTDADHSREGLEVSGEDASQDFIGLSGWEGHMDNLQQAQFEADPYGFQPRSY